MDCKSARYLLSFARPQGFDLAADERTALEHHLDNCTECNTLLQAERQFDAHVGQAVREVPVPAGLKERLLSKLKQKRDDWWKQAFNRGLRYAAAAAAVLLVVWAGFRWKAAHPPPVDTDNLVEAARKPEYARWSAGDAEKWFSDHGKKEVRVPREFNYNYLDSCSLADFNDRPIPHLLFLRTPQGSTAQVAQVFILTKKDYDLRGVQEKTERDPGYPAQIKVQPDNDQVFVIRYTGELDKLMQESE